MQHNRYVCRIKLSFVVSSLYQRFLRRKCKNSKKLCEIDKSKPALKPIRPTEFHTLVNQGFCRSACALSQKCNQTKSFQNLEHATAFQIRMKTFPRAGPRLDFAKTSNRLKWFGTEAFCQKGDRRK